MAIFRQSSLRLECLCRVASAKVVQLSILLRHCVRSSIALRIVVETRQWRGKPIQCIHGGAWSTRPKAPIKFDPPDPHPHSH